MRAVLLLPVVGSALALAGCGGAGDAITFKLDPRHRSGLDAVVTLVPAAGAASRLTIDLTDPAPHDVTAAVYRGTCAELPTSRVSAKTPVHGTQARLRVSEPPRALGRRERAVALKRHGDLLACGDVPPGRAAARGL